jgi:hypothetical protein
VTQNIILCYQSMKWKSNTKETLIQHTHKFQNSNMTISSKLGKEAPPCRAWITCRGNTKTLSFWGFPNMFSCCGVISQTTAGDWLWQHKQEALDCANRHALTLDILCTVLFKRRALWANQSCAEVLWVESCILHYNIQGVPLATEPDISLIIITPMKIL